MLVFCLVLPDVQSRSAERASMLSARLARRMIFWDGLVLPRFCFFLTARAASLTNLGASGSITSRMLRRGGAAARFLGLDLVESSPSFRRGFGRAFPDVAAPVVLLDRLKTSVILGWRVLGRPVRGSFFCLLVALNAPGEPGCLFLPGNMRSMKSSSSSEDPSSKSW